MQIIGAHGKKLSRIFTCAPKGKKLLGKLMCAVDEPHSHRGRARRGGWPSGSLASLAALPPGGYHASPAPRREHEASMRRGARALALFHNSPIR